MLWVDGCLDMLPPGNAPPGLLNEASGLFIVGRGIVPLDMLKRSVDEVPGGRVLPDPMAPKDPMAKAPGWFLVEPCLGPIPPGVRAELARDEASPSPMRVLI